MINDEEAPWAMQLVARVEKIDPPTTVEVCAAAAVATITLMAAEDAAEGGAWFDAIDAWQGGGRIRKLVRRARGAPWQRAQAPDGATAQVGRAEVRAYVPSRMDQLPDALSKLQIRSSPLDEPAVVPAVPPGGPADAIIVITPAVDMSWGKQAAQVAHAGQLLARTWSADRFAEWETSGRPVVVVHADDALWAQVDATAAVHVRDGGFTEIPAGTLTAVAFDRSTVAS